MIKSYIFKRKSSQWLFGLVLLSFVWVLGSTLYARERPATENGNHFLWSMQTAKNSIYFLGSIHLLKRDSYPLAAEIEKAYEDCTSIVFETDLDAMKEPGLQAMMISLGLYPAGQTIEQDISEETHKLLKEKVEAASLPLAPFARFRPWLCGQTLTVIELQRLGFDVMYGIDTYFYSKAKKDKKEMIFLESAEYQLKLLGEMNRHDQEEFLRQTLKDLDIIEEMAPDMVNAWETGDVDSLDEMITMSFKDHPEIYDRLVTERNRTWISRINNLAHQDGNVLVIVGAGHLIGKESVLDLLEERGYKNIPFRIRDFNALFLEDLFDAVRYMGYGIHPAPGITDPYSRLQINGRFSEVPDHHLGRGFPHGPIQFKGNFYDQCFSLFNIRIIGNAYRNPDPDLLCDGCIVNDIPHHDLVIGNDDHDVVGCLDLCGPEPDVYNIPPGGRILRGRPDFNPVAYLKGPVHN